MPQTITRNKYITKFSTLSEYNIFKRNTLFYTKPNVSYVEETDLVYFDKYVNENIVAIFDLSEYLSAQHVQIVGINIKPNPHQAYYTGTVTIDGESVVISNSLNGPQNAVIDMTGGERHVVMYPPIETTNGGRITKSVPNSFLPGCTYLTEIVFPEVIGLIGNACLSGCTNLTSVTCKCKIPPTLAANGNVIFNQNSCPIYVPAESVDTYKAADKWSTVASRIEAIP